MAVGTVMYLRPHKKGRKSNTALATLVVSVALSFVAGAMAAAHFARAFPRVALSVGQEFLVQKSTATRQCWQRVDMSRFISYQGDHNLVTACMVIDRNVDDLHQTAVAFSEPFTIGPSPIEIEIVLTTEERDLWERATRGRIVALGGRGSLSIKHYPLVIPKDVDPASLKTLRDVIQVGGRILNEDYYYLKR